MGPDDFSAAFQQHFHSIYMQCFRRLPSEHARLTPQTMAVLAHLAQTGPLTTREMAHHFNRAQSSISEMVERMVKSELLARRKDPQDGRKTLIWLSKTGLKSYQDACTPLDPALLSPLVERLTKAERDLFARLFKKLTKGEKPDEV